MHFTLLKTLLYIIYLYYYIIIYKNISSNKTNDILFMKNVNHNTLSQRNKRASKSVFFIYIIKDVSAKKKLKI